MRFLNCASSIASGLSFFAVVRMFAPWCLKRAMASLSDKPLTVVLKRDNNDVISVSIVAKVYQIKLADVCVYVGKDKV